MGFVKHLAKQVKVSVVGRNIAVVGNIVAEIRIGRAIKRRKPDTVYTQFLKIIEF